MATDPAVERPDLRRYGAVFVAQLALVAAAVLVSRLSHATRVGNALVLVIAGLNAGVVAFMLMGVRRDGRFISMLVLVIMIFIAGLLIWPAWDIYDRPTVF